MLSYVAVRLEPHASFTLTSRCFARQSSHRTRADAVDVRSLYFFWKNSRLGGSRSLTADPRRLRVSRRMFTANTLPRLESCDARCRAALDQSNLARIVRAVLLDHEASRPNRSSVPAQPVAPADQRPPARIRRDFPEGVADISGCTLRREAVSFFVAQIGERIFMTSPVVIAAPGGSFRC
jgi:hypothetical protein